ncbi:unnamed protein product [Moneuplotes crassus]|uniref:FCP1 homology domain-containing protein n=1 Tax=Euplotes crassus TaxID=5936 RepID=A0AAD1XX76_EUPCR|nr:unnamed protein product [Moneuplotes crassus]
MLRHKLQAYTNKINDNPLQTNKGYRKNEDHVSLPAMRIQLQEGILDNSKENDDELRPKILLKFEAKGEPIQQEVVLKNQPKDILMALKKDLPKGSPIGMEEAMNEDSLSISIQPSVSNLESSNSISSHKEKSVGVNDSSQDVLEKRDSLSKKSIEEEKQIKSKNYSPAIKDEDVYSDNSLDRGSEDMMALIKDDLNSCVKNHDETVKNNLSDCIQSENQNKEEKEQNKSHIVLPNKSNLINQEVKDSCINTPEPCKYIEESRIEQNLNTKNENNEMKKEIDDKEIDNSNIEPNSNSQERDRLIENKPESHKDQPEVQNESQNSEESKTQHKEKKAIHEFKKNVLEEEKVEEDKEDSSKSNCSKKSNSKKEKSGTQRVMSPPKIKLSLPVDNPIINMNGIKVIEEEDEEYIETPAERNKQGDLLPKIDKIIDVVNEEESDESVSSQNSSSKSSKSSSSSNNKNSNSSKKSSSSSQSSSNSSSSSSESSSSSQEEEQEIDPNEIDTEIDRNKFIKLEAPFYDDTLKESLELSRTASFGEDQECLIKAAPSFALLGFKSGNALKNKVLNKSFPKEESKFVKEVKDEVGPEYLSINPRNNSQPGFFYLAKSKEKDEFIKNCPRKKSIILDLPGVLVCFADSKSGGSASAQCVEIESKNGPKQFVYFWERPDLQWFMEKLKLKYEIILWSSLSKSLTDNVVSHIQRKSKYFSVILSREDCMSFEDRKPTNIAQSTLTLANKEEKKLMDISFSRIDRSLYPPKPVKDLCLLTKNRDPKSIMVVDCTRDNLTYMKKNSLFVKPFIKKDDNSNMFVSQKLIADMGSKDSFSDSQNEDDSSSSSSSSSDSDNENEEPPELDLSSEKEKLRDVYKFIKKMSK